MRCNFVKPGAPGQAVAVLPAADEPGDISPDTAGYPQRCCGAYYGGISRIEVFHPGALLHVMRPYDAALKPYDATCHAQLSYPRHSSASLHKYIEP